MYKLDLEKAEESEIKLATSAGSQEKAKELQKKTSAAASVTMLNPLTLWITVSSGKFLEMGISDHLTCLLKNLYSGQEATVKTRHGTMNWFQIGKGVHQGSLSPSLFIYCHPAYLTYMQSPSCKMSD